MSIVGKMMKMEVMVREFGPIDGYCFVMSRKTERLLRSECGPIRPQDHPEFGYQRTMQFNGIPLLMDDALPEGTVVWVHGKNKEDDHGRG